MNIGKRKYYKVFSFSKKRKIKAKLSNKRFLFAI